MSTTRRVAAGVLAALALTAPSACGTSEPGASGTPSAQPSITAPPTTTPPSTQPPTTPAQTQSPTAGPSASPTATTGTTVISARIAYQWHWPNDPSRPGTVSHAYPVPPVPELVRVGVGDHPGDPGERPFNRMSFTFNTGFPSYQFRYVDRLVGDASGLPIPLEGRGVLTVSFREAQAHTPDGTKGTIISQPAPHLGLNRMVSYAIAGDYEAVLTYGIGIDWPATQANPQIAVRVYEVTMQTRQGQRRYVVAIDVDASPLG